MELSGALRPGLVVKRVEKRLLGVCGESRHVQVTPSTNFSPILRNPIDRINATVGEFLIYRVPDVCIFMVFKYINESTIFTRLAVTCQ